MTRVLVSAMVDRIRPGVPSLWSVRVWGQPPHDRERTYDLEAPNDNMAAEEGIRRFVAEMEVLYEAGYSQERP